MDYKNAESLIKPLEIDISSSPDGIYVRRNIQEVETDDGIKYSYQEAFITKDEYETYSKELIVNQLNGEDNTKEYEAYKTNLNTGVLYTNGYYYKPIWADLYAEKVNKIMNMINHYSALGGDTTSLESITVNIYDITASPENAVAMTPKELIELWLFLLTKQEEFFNEYKKSLSA